MTDPNPTTAAPAAAATTALPSSATNTSAAPATETNAAAQPAIKTETPAAAAAGEAAPAKKEGEAQLLFEKPKDEVKPEDKKDDKPVEKPPVADMKKFLEEKLGDKKTELEGKTDEEITKLFDDAKAADAKAAEEAAKAPAFKIEDIKIPDTMPVTPEMKEKLTTIAGKHKLGTEAVQELIDTHVEIMNGQTAAWDNLKKGWRDETKSDPVIGGANLKTSVATANDVVRKFGGSEKELGELQDDLILLGLGNKKSFIRFCNNISKGTKEDTMNGNSNSGQPEKKSTAKTMWPNMPGDK